MQATALFDGDRLRQQGLVAVAFTREGCGFSARFMRTFDEWTPSGGVAKQEARLESFEDPLARRFRVQVTPTLALFQDGELAWRKDGILHEGLHRDDLDALEEEAKRLGD